MRQLEIIGFHLRHGGNVTDRTTAHDSKPRISSHQLHAATVFQGPSDVGSAGFIPPAHQTPSHLSDSKQRTLTQTGKIVDMFFI